MIDPHRPFAGIPFLAGCGGVAALAYRPQYKVAGMSAHVLISEHKRTCRGYRQIDAIEPKPTSPCEQANVADGDRGRRVRQPRTSAGS
jgi:hypothetical protein